LKITNVERLGNTADDLRPERTNLLSVVIHSQAGCETDRIDEVVEFWRQENPELDVLTKGLTMRLRAAWRLLERGLRQELSALEVEMWEFEMLLALRRSPCMRSSAGALLHETKVTSGAITNRLSRLEGRGWIQRDVDPTDRRQVLVTLTPDGRVQADKLIAAKNGAEGRFFAGMPRETLQSLSEDLRTLLATVEQGDPTGC
jgi:DNA-binding MarR family transcriptional regulator